MTVLWSTAEAHLAEAAVALAAGRLVALPTETVYGLAGDAFSEAAVGHIFDIKNRPRTSPLILHIASIAQLARCVRDYPFYVSRLMAHFWPGPLTLILPKSSTVPAIVTGGQETVAIRMPSHPVARAVLNAFSLIGSGCVAAPSANPFGRLSAVCAQQIQSYFPSSPVLAGIIDAGPSSGGIESTILSCVSESPTILRPGPITAAALTACLGRTVSYQAPHASSVRVPGDVRHHYQPRVTLYYGSPERLAQHCAGRGQGVWIGYDAPPDALSCLAVHCLPCRPDVYMRTLFYLCYEAEQKGADYIAVQQIPTTESWRGLRDRLYRAASDWWEDDVAY